MKHIFLPLLCVILITVEVNAQNPNLGTAGAQFLQIPVSARATAMGGAYVAQAQGAEALYWNPAGITHVDNYGVHLSHIQWFDTIELAFVGVVMNVKNIGSIGLSVNSLTMDKMEVTSELQPNGTGEFWNAQDFAVGLTYARRLTDRFSAGITGKFIRQRIWHESATGVAFDFGTQYRIDFNNLTIAMAMTNFGSDLRMDGMDLEVRHDNSTSIPGNRLTPSHLLTEEYPLPLHFQVGIAMDVVHTPFLLIRAAIDAAHPNDNDERINTGTEITVRQLLSLRGGYRYNYDDESFTFGTGIVLPLSASRIRVDYAYALYDLLPDVQRFSVELEF